MGIVDLEQLERNEAEDLKQARDALDLELADVKNTSGSVPEKYRGKSLEEVIAMHESAEKKLSRLGNEVGQLRTFRSQVELEPKPPQKKEVNVDALLENPEEAVETIVSQSRQVRELKESVERLTTGNAKEKFESHYPNYEQDLKDEAFIEWAFKNPVRAALAQEADKYNFNAANELWSMWEERKELVGQAESQKKQQKVVEKEKKLRDGTLESGTGNSTETKKVFSRREIRELKTRALQGDRKAEAIVSDPEWQAQTMQAYFDKRAR